MNTKIFENIQYCNICSLYIFYYCLLFFALGHWAFVPWAVLCTGHFVLGCFEVRLFLDGLFWTCIRWIAPTCAGTTLSALETTFPSTRTTLSAKRTALPATGMALTAIRTTASTGTALPIAGMALPATETTPPVTGTTFPATGKIWKYLRLFWCFKNSLKLNYHIFLMFREFAKQPQVPTETCSFLQKNLPKFCFLLLKSYWRIPLTASPSWDRGSKQFLLPKSVGIFVCRKHRVIPVFSDF